MFIGHHDILDIETNLVVFKKLFNFLSPLSPSSLVSGLSPATQTDSINRNIGRLGLILLSLGSLTSGPGATLDAGERREERWLTLCLH